MTTLPEARTADILEQEAGEEIMIYDLRIDKAYVLNATSKTVYKACNGETTLNDLKIRTQFSDELIYLALNELARNALLDADYTLPLANLDRREAIRRAGLASVVALPLVAGITAPRSANAASGSQALYSTCTTEAQSGSTECRSGRCSRTQIISRGGDGVGNNTSNSGFTRCCAPTNTGAGYESGYTYYRANDCSFASLCCTGSGRTPGFPNAKGSYDCTCD